MQKKWNWQQNDWPNFTYNPSTLKSLEEEFLYNSGLFIGTYKHINDQDKSALIIDVLEDEALKTSEIEGEYLQRDSLQFSIRRNLGLDASNRKVSTAEQGISEIMVDLYKNYNAALTHELLFRWHEMLVKGRRDIKEIGGYRCHLEPMQVVSGPLHKPRIHFEAPPSTSVQKEMEKFIQWFNKTAPEGDNPLPPLTRASIAHLYFVSIHPFEDGNGRIGRAIAEKSLSQSIKQPIMISLSRVIQERRKLYYEMLEKGNKNNQIDNWNKYFSSIVLEAQSYTIKLVEFIIQKAKFYDIFKNKLNTRQEKVIQSIFKQGLKGFEGGLSAENYIRITGTSRATTTRDLQGLVNIKAFTKTGAGKGTRYYLNIS